MPVIHRWYGAARAIPGYRSRDKTSVPGPAEPLLASYAKDFTSSHWESS
ncbi:hypothetical protein [Flexivirga caeni]|nr:hypothetical protein [Flexivirga caeni]